MIVVRNENVVYFDVDETLVYWTDDEFEIDANFYGKQQYIKPHFAHIDFLKSLKSRGYYIVVHSGNGYQWAEQVVKLLELEDSVDEVKTKPCKIIDDKPLSDWLGPVIYIKE
jgi:hydroxymethylpyrimidine pyrophosphatase-like HAD family hydrolase